MTQSLLAWRLRLTLASFLIAALRLICGAGSLQLVTGIDSGQTPPAGGGGDSYAPIISHDGRFVLFTSAANNLITISNNAFTQTAELSPLNVYLRDRVKGTTRLVSVNLSGSAGGNGDSVPTGLSNDGRFALFESQASNLVAGDTNNAADVFVRDMRKGVTVLVSAGAQGAANGASRDSVMTAHGRYVAFVSEANNLVDNDTNGVPNVFLRDLKSQTTTLISVGAMPVCAASFCGSESPEISADGRYVAFFSRATNLVSGVTNLGEIYVRDVIGGTTIWASTNALMIMQSIFGISNVVSFNHTISADGKFVAFETSANRMSQAVATGVILRFGLDTGLTDVVDTNACFPKTSAYQDMNTLSMTPDGRFIAFVANTNDNSGNTTCVELWDARSQRTTLVSGDLAGNVPINSTCDWPTLDATGRFVAFVSSATNLVTNSLTGDYHLYRREVQAGTTTLIDADTNGIGASVMPSTVPRLSSGGRLIAFESLDANLVPDDRNHALDVFVRNVRTDLFDLISARDPALPSGTANGQSGISPFALSGDGRWLAFASDADNLTSNDTAALGNVFVRDLLFQTNLLISVATNGVDGDGVSTEAAISSNGRFVAFTSLADNLVAQDSNQRQDVFVRDLQTGTTVLASVNFAGTGPGNHESYSPALSADGRFVLFRSRATNLGTNSFTGTENLFVRDLQLARTYALTTSGLPPGSAAVFSPDGSLVAYSSMFLTFLWSVDSTSVVNSNLAGPPARLAVSPNNELIAVLLSSLPSLRVIDRLSNSNWQISSSVAAAERAGIHFSGDSRFLVYAASPAPDRSLQVFIYNFQTGATNLISQGFDGLTPGNADSDSPIISPDGRYVVYRSLATNLVAGTENNRSANIFKFDRTLGTTTLLTSSVNAASPANNRSFAPLFSSNGAMLLIPSAASDLVMRDFNQSSDLFAENEAIYLWVVERRPGQGPTLAWFARPGQGYRVQCKTKLNDPEWQEAAGAISVNGCTVQFTGSGPSANQCFYRVIAF